jgi:hypothetical protein
VVILNGPIAKTLEVNAGMNCIGQALGQRHWAGVRLILQNIGALPGAMDPPRRARQDQLLLRRKGGESVGPLRQAGCARQVQSPWSPPKADEHVTLEGSLELAR